MLLRHLKISGHSMEPTISDNASVLASSVPFLLSKPKVGDIVVFKDADKLIVKRIKELKNDTALVSGDNKMDSKSFGWINKSSILAKVIFNF